MHLDVNTLMVAGSFVSMLSGCFLALAWWWYRGTSAALFWSAANFLVGIAIGIFAFHDVLKPEWLVYITGLFVLASGLVWAAARRFDHRSAPPAVTFAGAAAWIVACLVPGFTAAGAVHSILGAAIIAGYTYAAGWGLWRDGRERLFARWPMIALLVVHGTLFVASIVDVLLGAPPNEDPNFGSVFSLVHFEHMVFTIGTAIFLIAMMKERSEVQHKKAATVDSLTGLSNRGAFMEGATEELHRHVRNKEPISVLIFDIDRFKTINDTFGHATGDRVIECFAAVARESVRAIDIVGRIGGEEFAIVLPGAAADVGFAYAERVRNGFQAACATLPGGAVTATVSVGVAICEGEACTFSEVLRRADDALYRAKARGRNQTVLARKSPASGMSRVVRIA
ncbi:GGDEF domain-containing protein [Microbaculum marinum]|uniref:diguanylate cyclase n=1 Tax=Microbaculum marinum TaxID=1764581 RepID=A0AAW9RRT9_9HYPH